MIKRHTIKIIAAVVTLSIAIALIVLLIPKETPAPQTTPDTPVVATPRAQPSTLTGVARFSDNTPAQNISITLGEQTTTSSKDGTFSLPIPTQDSTLTASYPQQLAPPDTYTQDIKKDETHQGLIIPKPGTISGQILAKNTPLKDATLSLLYSKTNTLTTPSTTPFTVSLEQPSSSTGTFSLDHVPPGEFKILAEHKDHPLYMSRSFDLNAGDQLDDITIDVAPDTGLTVSLVSTDNTPVQGNLILFNTQNKSSQKHTINPSAPLLIQNLPAHTPLNLIASAPGHAYTPLSITLNPGEIQKKTITLDRAPSHLSGIVLASNYTPVSKAVIRFNDNKRPRIARTSAQGEFELKTVSAPTTLTASSPYHAKKTNINARPGTPSLIVLPPGGHISGQTISARGAAITSYSLEVTDFQPAIPPRYTRINTFEPLQVQNNTGTFSLGPLQPGTYYLRARANEDIVGYSTPIQVSSAQTTSNITITIQKPGSISGQVIDQASGKPIPNVAVSLLENSATTLLSTKSDAQGNFTFETVPPGRQSIRASHKGYKTQFAAGINVTPDSTVTQNISMEKGNDKRGFSFYGIGATLGQNKEGIFIRQVLPGSPAQKAGVQQGDYILAVDGKITDDFRTRDAVNLIRGMENTTVQLEVRRNQARVTLNVIRGKIDSQ